MLRRTRVYAEVIQKRSSQINARQIVIKDLPPEPNGIFFFRDELIREVQKRAGTMSIIVDSEPLPLGLFVEKYCSPMRSGKRLIARRSIA